MLASEATLQQRWLDELDVDQGLCAYLTSNVFESTVALVEPINDNTDSVGAMRLLYGSVDAELSFVFNDVFDINGYQNLLNDISLGLGGVKYSCLYTDIDSEPDAQCVNRLEMGLKQLLGDTNEDKAQTIWAVCFVSGYQGDVCILDSHFSDSRCKVKLVRCPSFSEFIYSAQLKASLWRLLKTN